MESYKQRVLRQLLVLLGMSSILVLLAYGVSWFRGYRAGQQSCQSWFGTGVPSLEAISIQVRGQRIVCRDPPTLDYIQECFSCSEDWLYGPHAVDVTFGIPCIVRLEFSDGTVYRSPKPSTLSSTGLGLSIPGEVARELGWGTTVVPFKQPMPDAWRSAIDSRLPQDAHRDRDSNSLPELATN